MTVTYHIVLKNRAGEQVAIFSGAGRDGLRNFGYHKQLRLPGQWYMRLDGAEPKTALFEPDGQVEFWRRDPVGGLDWYKDYEGIILSSEINQDDEGQDIYIVRGRGYNDLLATEVIYGKAGTSLTSKAGPAETVAKEFVNEALGPGATPDDLGYSRVRHGFFVEPSAGTGAYWEGKRMMRNLLEVCYELAEYAPADYNVVGIGPAQYEFRWRPIRWGKDKTAGQPDPVVFATQLGNMSNPHYLFSRMDEVNVVYVLGQGVGEEREIRTVVQIPDAITSPIARRAVARQANNESTTEALDAIGRRFLIEQRARSKLTFQVRQTFATRYGRDWDFGDLVTVVYTKPGEQRNMKIIGVRVQVDEAGIENITPDLQDE